MRHLLVLFLLAASLGAASRAGAAEPAPHMSWDLTPARGPEDDATLAFGVPGTDAVRAILRCRKGSGRVVVSSFPNAARRNAPVRLTSGAATSRHRAHVEPNEAAEGVLVETRAPASDVALQAFRRGGPLSISVGRGRTDLPVAPRALIRQFFGSCGD